jgi:competence protein ComEC
MSQSEKKKKIVKFICTALLCAVILAGCTINISFDDSENSLSDEIQVHFIDVGQGDSSLIITDNFNILIDAGEKEEAYAVNSYLNEHGVEKLDYIIATHPHSDHIGGLAQVIAENDVDTVIIPHMTDDKIPTTKVYAEFLNAVDEKDCNLEEAYVGEILNFGDAEIEIIAPVNDDYSDLNNFSVISELTYGDTKFLFTGDAEVKSENEVLKNGMFEDTDVLKVGHHGSNSSTGEKFLEVVKPEYAVISCGEGNSYNHPNEETIQRLLEYTDNIYRTDLQGNIVITSDGTDIKVDYDNKQE